MLPPLVVKQNLTMQADQLSYPVPQNQEEATVRWVLRDSLYGSGSEGRRAPPVLCPACVTTALMQSASASH